MTPRQFNQALERAAEAAHDRFYEITAEMSDLGYAFADDRTKRHWREVAVVVLRSLEGL
jgi:hypothetical protein